jgi:hypothetical protein
MSIGRRRPDGSYSHSRNCSGYADGSRIRSRNWNDVRVRRGGCDGRHRRAVLPIHLKRRA